LRGRQPSEDEAKLAQEKKPVKSTKTAAGRSDYDILQEAVLRGQTQDQGVHGLRTGGYQPPQTIGMTVGSGTQLLVNPADFGSLNLCNSTVIPATYFNAAEVLSNQAVAGGNSFQVQRS